MKLGRFPVPTSFSATVWTFVPRFVTMNNAATPRVAVFGLILIAWSVTITLTGTVAAGLVVSGRLIPGPTSTSDAAVAATATTKRLLTCRV